MKNANQKLSPKFWFSIIALAIVSSIIAIIITNSNLNQPVKNTTPSAQKTDKTTSQPEAAASGSSTTQPSSSTTQSTTSTTQSTPSASTTPSTSTPSTPTTQTSPSVNSNTCLHEVSGLCLDDYEDEAYSTGLYDHEYGYYGTSLDFPDGCNSACQEALEDAYDEGWYDAH